MSCFKLDVLLICALCIPGVVTKYTPYLNPGFFFDYNKQNQSVPIPITQQCERIHISWGRRTARGAEPVAPFYVQVFTSTVIAPFLIPVGNGPTFDWDVPFAPGTQYQLCMYDRHGVSGGCQAMYTVIQNSTTDRPTCQNVTMPGNLDVLVTVPSGPMSQYGFIDQCTDMTVTPKSGKPPFTLTIAPSLHPPFNITSNSMAPITWTVSLSWASLFFVALSSSDGDMWSNGPMHAGGFGPSDCLSPGSMPRKMVTKVALGAGVGSAVGGIALGLLCAYLNARYRRRKSSTSPILEKTPDDKDDTEAAHSLPPLPSFPSRHSRFGQGLSLFSGSRPESITVEPFTADPSPGYIAEGLKGRPEGRWRGLAFSTMSSARPGLPSRLRIATRPFPPVISEGTERTSSVPSYSRMPETEIFVELPPKYIKNPTGSADVP